MSDLEYDYIYLDDDEASTPLEVEFPAIKTDRYTIGLPKGFQVVQDRLSGAPMTGDGVRPHRCECGAHKTSFPNNHYSWCPEFKEFKGEQD